MVFIATEIPFDTSEEHNSSATGIWRTQMEGIVAPLSCVSEFEKGVSDFVEKKGFDTSLSLSVSISTTAPNLKRTTPLFTLWIIRKAPL